MAAPRPASTPSAVELRLSRVGASGDGVGTLADGRPAYAPLTLPGEKIRFIPGAKRGDGVAGIAEALLETSADRVTPPCPHFLACGGCALQHWADSPYGAWKSLLLTEALRRAGFPAQAAPLVRTAPGSRRRVDLAVRRQGGAVLLGLHGRGGAEIVDLHACAVLAPPLVALLPPLRQALAGLAALKREASAIINLLDSGPDLLLRLDSQLTTSDRAALADFARAQGIARIAWAEKNAAPEIACQLRPATTRLGGVEILPPSGAFLQASEAGEAEIRAAVLAGLPRTRGRVIELFAGVGTLSFALAERASLRAFEGDPAAVACLRRAAHGRRIEILLRDLARQPLQPAAFSGAACVVLDPPFAGAAAQMAPLAKSGVGRVIYVSCNPAALARDAAVLRQAGYQLLGATPIDQFLWSARLESVVVFGKPR